MEVSCTDLVPVAPGCTKQRSSKRSEALEALPLVCGTPGSDGKEYGEDDEFFAEFHDPAMLQVLQEVSARGGINGLFGCSFLLPLDPLCCEVNTLL